MLDIKTIRSSRPNNLKDASEREAVLLKALDLLGAAQPAAAAPRTATASTTTSPAAKPVSGTAALLSAIAAAEKATFEPLAKAALDNVLTAASKLTQAEAEAPGIRGLMAFVARVVSPTQTGRVISAVAAIGMIATAKRNMVFAK